MAMNPCQTDIRMTGEEFKALREQVGLTQAELAALMGVNQQNISRVEDRGPTRWHVGHIRALLFIVEEGLLAKFEKWLKERED